MPLHSVDGVTHHQHPHGYRYRYQSGPRHGTLRVLNPSESTPALSRSRVPSQSRGDTPSPSHSGSGSVNDSGCAFPSPSHSPSVSHPRSRPFSPSASASASASASVSPPLSSSPPSPVPSRRKVPQCDDEDISAKIRRRRRAFVEAVTAAVAEGRDSYTQPYRYSQRSKSRVEREQQQRQQYLDFSRQARDEDRAKSSSSTLPPYENPAGQGLEDVVVLSPEVDYSAQLALQVPQRAHLHPHSQQQEQEPHYHPKPTPTPPTPTPTPPLSRPRPRPVEKDSRVSYIDTPWHKRPSEERERVWPWPAHLRSPQPQVPHQPRSPHQPGIETKMKPKFADIKPLSVQRKHTHPHLPRQLSQYPQDQHLYLGRKQEQDYDSYPPSPPYPYPHRSLRPGQGQGQGRGGDRLPARAPVPVPVPISEHMPPPAAASQMGYRYRSPDRGGGQDVQYYDPRAQRRYSYTQPLPPPPPHRVGRYRGQEQQRHQPVAYYDHLPPLLQTHSNQHPPSLRPSYQPQSGYQPYSYQANQHPSSSSSSPSSVYSSAYSYSRLHPHPRPQSYSYPQTSASYSPAPAPVPVPGRRQSRSRGPAAPVVRLSVDGLSYEDADDMEGGGGLGLSRAQGRRGGVPGADADADDAGAPVAGQPPLRALRGQAQGRCWTQRHWVVQPLPCHSRRVQPRLQPQPQPPPHHQRQQQQHWRNPQGGPATRQFPLLVGQHQHQHQQSAREAPDPPHPRPVYGGARSSANANAGVVSQQPQRHPGMASHLPSSSMAAQTTRTARTAWNPKGMPLYADGTREWSTDLCGFCDHNLGTCCKALWCPCIVYAQNKARVEHLYEKNAPLSEQEMQEMGEIGTCNCNEDCVIHGMLSAVSGCVAGWVIQIQSRTFIRRRYAISGDWLGDCCAALCCCSACALAQESREIELEEVFRRRRDAGDVG